jgi:hypothetical protein
MKLNVTLRTVAVNSLRPRPSATGNVAFLAVLITTRASAFVGDLAAKHQSSKVSSTIMRE